MKLRTLVETVALVAVLSCSSGGGKRRANPFYDHVDSSKPTGKPEAGKPADGKPAGKLGPVGEKAQTLREAADQLDKAQETLDRGNRSLAEQLFSTAELLVGPEALAAIAPRFRDGAPPRVTTPTQKIDTAAPPQPKTAGSSEAEDEADKVPPPPKVETASLTGMIKVEGGAGTLGLITLEPASGKWKPRTPKRVVVEQRNREFLPNLIAVSVGSTITFPNFDGVFHNVFSTAPAAPFDLGLYKAGEAREFTFAKEGIIRLGCNLHANMSAYIAVVAAPAYVVTDAGGAFAFRRLTPGKYKLRAWSIRTNAPVEREITLKAGKNQIDLGVAADAPAGPQPDKFGGKRG